jgi:hypothetical protein
MGRRVEAFEGNAAETTTMLPSIQAFTMAHRLTDVIVVADAGTVSDGNKAPRPVASTMHVFLTNVAFLSVLNTMSIGAGFVLGPLLVALKEKMTRRPLGVNFSPPTTNPLAARSADGAAAEAYAPIVNAPPMRRPVTTAADRRFIDIPVPPIVAIVVRKY